jgi:hypothetical protein
MPGVEVSSAEMKRRLPDEQRSQVDAHLTAGRGVALYADQRGRASVLATFGTRESDFPGQPPGRWSGGELHSFTRAPAESKPLRSPLLDWQPVPQIARPPVAPSHTEWPSVEFSTRSGPHPRGNREYIDARRTPQQLQEEEPPAPLSEAQAWWRTNLGQKR